MTTTAAPETSQAGLFKEPARDSIWRRCIFKPEYDPYDVLTTLFEVRTKSARIVPFVPFRTQRLMNQKLGLKNTIVKPRQVGSSTYNLGIMTANSINCPNLNTLIVTHLDETTAAMRQTVQNFIHWLNDNKHYGLEIGRDNENELEILTTNSHFYFGTAGGKGVGRSRTIHQMLASEVAHWQGQNPGAEYGAMTESIPDNGFLVAESTPNGASGLFYDLYQQHNGYVKHFYPWFIEPSRRVPLNGHQLTLTDEESLLVMMYGLSHEQIAWRRVKTAELRASKLDFAQEYPEDDITCWTAGTRPYFPPQRMNILLRTALTIPHGTEDWPGENYDPGGELWIWEQPKDGHQYLCTGDVGGGHIDGDRSIACIFDLQTKRHVATLKGWWKPQSFADLTIRLALRYNGAYLSHEANSIGQGAVDQAFYTRKYKNYHMEQRKRNMPGQGNENEEEWKPGFYIPANGRTDLINGVLDVVLDGGSVSPDSDLIREMTMARLERGKVGGGWKDIVSIPPSVHDDHLFAFAQGCALMKIVSPLSGAARRTAPGT